MSKTKQVTFGLLTGTALLVACAFLAQHWLMDWLSDPRAIGDLSYFVSEPTSLAPKIIANDHWMGYETEGIEPIAIQRVEYADTWAVGRKRWGYFLFFKGRVTDSELQTKIRNLLSTTPQVPLLLPNWVSHVPKWWNPSAQISGESLPDLLSLSKFVYVTSSPEEIIIYWLREPYNGFI